MLTDIAGLGLPGDIERGLREFCRGVVQACGDGEVRSITVYGSAARGEYTPGRSDVNVLVVVRRADLEALGRAAEAVGRAAETCCLTPLFLTPEDIETSRDVFPIRFLDMRDAYVVLHGEDVLGDLQVSSRNLRLELEQELKILLLELRQFYLHRARGGPGGADHILAWFNSFLHLARRLLELQGSAPPARLEDLARALAERCGLDAAALGRLVELKRGRPLRDAAAEAVGLYRLVARAAEVADKLEAQIQ